MCKCNARHNGISHFPFDSTSVDFSSDWSHERWQCLLKIRIFCCLSNFRWICERMAACSPGIACSNAAFTSTNPGTRVNILLNFWTELNCKTRLLETVLTLDNSTRSTCNLSMCLSAPFTDTSSCDPLFGEWAACCPCHIYAGVPFVWCSYGCNHSHQLTVRSHRFSQQFTWRHVWVIFICSMTVLFDRTK